MDSSEYPETFTLAHEAKFREKKKGARLNQQAITNQKVKLTNKQFDKNLFHAVLQVVKYTLEKKTEKGDQQEECCDTAGESLLDRLAASCQNGGGKYAC